MAVSEVISFHGFFFRNVLKGSSLAYSNVVISIPFQDAGSTNVHTEPQLKVCLLERILEPVSIYTDACMMIIYFCLKGSQRHPEFYPNADHAENWGKSCN